MAIIAHEQASNDAGIVSADSSAAAALAFENDPLRAL